jgi:hypothetical protein
MVDVADHQAAAVDDRSELYRYTMHIVDEKGDNVRDVIETHDGTVARTVLRNGRPLTPAENQFEKDRLNDLLNDPSIYAKRQKRDQTSRRLGQKLIRQMPQAMLYTLTPGQPQVPGPPQIVVDFTPDPAHHAADMESEVLTGLRGRLWIDATQHTVIHGEGHIFAGVSIGLGVVAKLYPGGEIQLDQTQIGRRWIFTHFADRLVVRALMVKTMRVNTDVDSSHFEKVPEMSFQDAAKLLLQTH